MRISLVSIFTAFLVMATAVADDFGTRLRSQLNAENKALITYHYSAAVQGKVGNQNPRFIYYFTAPKDVLAAQPRLSELNTAKKSLPDIIRIVQERIARQSPDLEMDSLSILPTNDDRARHYLLFYFRRKGSSAPDDYERRIIALWDGTILKPAKHELTEKDSYAIDMKGTLEPHK